MQNFETGAKTVQANNLVLSVVNNWSVCGSLRSIAEKVVCIDISKSDAIVEVANICKAEALKSHNNGGEKIKASDIKEAAKIILAKVVRTYIENLRSIAQPETLEVVRVKNDVNGNPRFVIHFLAVLPESLSRRGEWVSDKYARALVIAKEFGGRKYHNKSYGGGIVFSSYSIDEEIERINALSGRNYVGYRVG